MLSAMPTTTSRALRVLALTVGGFVVLNVAFYVLSGSYFENARDVVEGVGSLPKYTADQAASIRVQFALFSGEIAIASFFAGMWPRQVGHLFPVLLGLIDLVAGFGAITRHAPGVLCATLLISGVLFPLLAYFSARGKRAPWAFLVAMCGVFALVEVFGAPKLRDELGVGLWTAMLLPGLNLVAVVTLIMLRGQYAERGVAAAA